LLLPAVLLVAWLAEGEASAQASGYVHLVNRNSGMCLGVEGASTAQNAWVNEYHCDTGASQYWYFAPVAEGGPFTIVNLNSFMCLDIPNGSVVDGTRLQQFPCHGGPAQQFTIPHLGEWFSIVNARSNRCLKGPVVPWYGGPVKQFGCGTTGLERQWVSVP
jgi:hypothetical protein